MSPSALQESTGEQAPAPSPEPTSSVPLLRVEHISKRFGPVQALDDVSMEIQHNSIVALLGDNGAGKSTLIKIISGVYHADKGDMFWNGNKVTISSPAEARNLGIEVTHQEIALSEQINVYRNVFLGKELEKRYLGGLLRLLDDKKMDDESKKLLAQLRIRVPSTEIMVRYLSGGQRQAVAIARCVYWNAKLLILDEPTAALGVTESKAVLDLLVTLKNYASVIIITHNLRHAMSVADRVVVLRHGQVIGNDTAKTLTLDTVETMMEGDIA